MRGLLGLLLAFSGCCWHDKHTHYEHIGGAESKADIRVVRCYECNQDLERQETTCRHAPAEIMPWWGR